jgi:holin-like protein
VYYLGEILQKLFSLPIPGAVLGLIMLFIALYAKIIKVEMIEDITEFLLSHMSFLFVPAGVGLITSLGIISRQWVAFSVILIVSTAVVWIVTAYVVKALGGRRAK